ncbi:MAG: hypothetical protein Q4P31_05725 [Andreesenia angusta]|nr:hypothetical protein [Andreesenia angusta]
MEQIERFLKNIGFKNINIDTKPLSEEYAKKWGISEIDVKKFLVSGYIRAEK